MGPLQGPPPADVNALGSPVCAEGHERGSRKQQGRPWAKRRPGRWQTTVGSALGLSCTLCASCVLLIICPSCAVRG